MAFSKQIGYKSKILRSGEYFKNCSLGHASVINHKQPKMKERNCLTEEREGSSGEAVLEKRGQLWGSC